MSKFARKKTNPKKCLRDLRASKLPRKKPSKKIRLLASAQYAVAGPNGDQLLHLSDSTFVYMQEWGRYSAVSTKWLKEHPEVSCGCGECVVVTCPGCKKKRCGQSDFCIGSKTDFGCGKIWN